MLLQIKEFLSSPRPLTAITWAALFHSSFIAVGVVCLASTRQARSLGDSSVIYMSLSEHGKESSALPVALHTKATTGMLVVHNNHAHAPSVDMEQDFRKANLTEAQVTLQVLAPAQRQEFEPTDVQQDTTNNSTIVRSQTMQSAAPQTIARIAEALGTNAKTPPDFSGNRYPSYPLEAIRHGYTGRAILRLYVTEAGQVERVVVVKSTGHTILDRSAVATVSEWQGKPAKFNGKPIATIELLPVIFRLPPR